MLVSTAECTCVSHKHDVVLLGNECIQEVCQAGCVHSGHKKAGEAVWHVAEAWNLVLPGYHAAAGVVYIVVKHHALQAGNNQTHARSGPPRAHLLVLMLSIDMYTNA